MLLSSSHLPICFVAGCCCLLARHKLNLPWKPCHTQPFSFLDFSLEEWPKQVSSSQFLLTLCTWYSLKFTVDQSWLVAPCQRYSYQNKISKNPLLVLINKHIKIVLKGKNKKELKCLHGILNHNMSSCWLNNNISVDFISEIVTMPNYLICVEILQMWGSLH